MMLFQALDRTQRFVLAARLAAILAVGLGMQGVPHCLGQELLPDLKPWVEEDDPYLVNWIIQGDEIRLQTMVGNIGDGLLQLRTDDAAQGGATTPLRQRIFVGEDNGPTYNDYFVANAPNLQDGHIYFDNFTNFQLLEANIDSQGIVTVGEVASSTLKTSCFLVNSRAIPDAQYDGFPRQNSLNPGVYQNISVGYGDIYSYQTDGQYVSLDGVEPGLYWLRQNVDPLNLLRETDDTNNSYEILIDLGAPGTAIRHPYGTFVQPGDRLAGFGDLMGDYNGDSHVNAADYVVFRNHQGQVDNLFNGLADPDTGQIDQEDYDHWASHYGNASAGGSTATVPEPATSILLLLWLVTCGVRQRALRRG